METPFLTHRLKVLTNKRKSSIIYSFIVYYCMCMRGHCKTQDINCVHCNKNNYSSSVACSLPLMYTKTRLLPPHTLSGEKITKLRKIARLKHHIANLEYISTMKGKLANI